MTPENRDLFHWIQALVALPAAAYAGRPFYGRPARVEGMGGVAEGGEPQPDRLDIRRGVRCPLHREAPLGAYVEAHAAWSEANTRPSLGRNYDAFVTRSHAGAARAATGSPRHPPRRPVPTPPRGAAR
jgi:hypothetical protein